MAGGHGGRTGLGRGQGRADATVRGGGKSGSSIVRELGAKRALETGLSKCWVASAGCISIVRQLEDERVSGTGCCQCWQAEGQLAVL